MISESETPKEKFCVSSQTELADQLAYNGLVSRFEVFTYVPQKSKAHKS